MAVTETSKIAQRTTLMVLSILPSVPLLPFQVNPRCNEACLTRKEQAHKPQSPFNGREMGKTHNAFTRTLQRVSES